MRDTPRTVAFCADDFGLSPEVSRTIIDLAMDGRLNAVSCLVNGTHWQHDAPLLDGLPDAVDVGLHFNLTEGQPLSAELRREWQELPSLPRIITAAHLHALPIRAIASELAAQRASFSAATSRMPDFIDGHQHIHHLPMVRDLLLEAISAEAARPAVRNTGTLPGPGFVLKRFAIAATGGRALQKALIRRGVLHNSALLGVYDFRQGTYRQSMQRWLAAIPPSGALLFCHPGGSGSNDGSDVIAAARAAEAAYLGSDAFADDLAAAGAQIGRVWRPFSEMSRRD